MTLHPFVAIVGPPAAGKTTLARTLQKHGWTYVAIDDIREHGGDWPEFIARINELADKGPLVVESVAITREYRKLLHARRALLVCVTCPPPVRRERLKARGARFERARHDDRAIAHCVVDGADDATLGEAARLASQARAVIDGRLRAVAPLPPQRRRRRMPVGGWGSPSERARRTPPRQAPRNLYGSDEFQGPV